MKKKNRKWLQKEKERQSKIVEIGKDVTDNSILAEYGQRGKLRDGTGPDWFEQNEKLQVEEMKSRKKYDESGDDDDFEDDFEGPPPKKRAATAKKTTTKKPKYTEDVSDSDIDFMGSSQAASKPRSRATSSGPHAPPRSPSTLKRLRFRHRFYGILDEFAVIYYASMNVVIEKRE